MCGNILIIDDSPIERKVIGKAIRRLIKEINIIEVDNGLNITDKLVKNNIHLCILDIMMPGKDGFEILEEIKNDYTLREIPVIVCTGLSDKQAIEKALNLGAYDYFSKPLSEEGLKISLPLKAKNAIDLMQRKEELKKKESEIYELAYINSTTALPNKNKFKEIVTELINNNNANGKFALIYIDLDNFKEVNDVFGHDFGDKVLYHIAQRLRKNETENCSLFSMGGDEFVILVINWNDNLELEMIVQKVLANIKEPVLIDRNVFHITASCGVVNYPDHGKNYDELLKNADAAMYRSKETEKGYYCFFDKTIGQAILRKTQIQSNLRKALERNEFLVYYQPQLNIETNRISGFEALIRWNSPEQGIIPPLAFIKNAEESRQIISIGEWVLENACRFIKQVNERFSTDYYIAVNISVIQLLEAGFLEKAMNILETTGLPARLLEMEITESVFLYSTGQTIKTLEKLQSQGIKIALDDFGTGYSSLNYLRELPISTIKIDKAFISSMFESNKNSSLTSNIIKMGHDLGMKVVAEGVEHKSQQTFLANLKCDKIQGYILSRPIAQGDVMDFLKNFNNHIK